MRCLKCGRHTDSTAVFCEACAADMEQHPVSRETPLILHTRPQREPVKKKKTVTPEEIIMKLKKHRKRLVIACVALALICALLSGALVYLLTRPSREYGLGQNYNTAQQSGQTGGLED